MANKRAVAITAEIALTAATTRTVLQVLSASNIPLKVKGWGIYFDGTSTTGEPVQVELLRQTTAGSGSGSVTPVARNDESGTIQATAISGPTSEPTAGNVLDMAEVHPQSGYEVIYPPGDEIEVPSGGRLGIRATAPANVNARAKIYFEE